MSEENTQTPAKNYGLARKTTLTLSRMDLTAPNPRLAEAGKEVIARFGWALYKGNPRAIVYTKDPALDNRENNFGKITAPLDMLVFFSLVAEIRELPKKENGFKKKLANKSTYRGNEKFDSPQHINDILVGKDNEGCCYISILEEGKTPIKFVFGPSDWHHWAAKDGTPIGRKEVSEEFAIAYANMLTEIVPRLAAEWLYEDQVGPNDPGAQAADAGQPAKTWNNNGGGNRGNWNKGNGGGYNKGGWNKGGGGGYNKGNWNNSGGGNRGNYNAGGGGGNRNEDSGGGDVSLSDLDF